MNKKILLGVGVLVMMLVAVVVAGYLAMFSAEVQIEFAPKVAEVRMDGKRVKKFDKVRVRPGRHKIVAEREGFVRYEKEVEVGRGEKREVVFFMEANEGNNYYDEHEDDRVTAVKAVDMGILEGAAELKKRYPILEILPLDLGADRFKIDYMVGGEGVVVTISDCRGDNRQEAKEYVESFDLRFEDYKVKCLK